MYPIFPWNFFAVWPWTLDHPLLHIPVPNHVTILKTLLVDQAPTTVGPFKFSIFYMAQETLVFIVVEYAGVPSFACRTAECLLAIGATFCVKTPQAECHVSFGVSFSWEPGFTA